MISFNIYTLGCKVNQYDSNSLKRKLISSGFKYKKNNAEVAIINTCSVTKSAMGKNKRMVNRARKENRKAKIILIGCWLKVYDIRARDLGVDYVFRTGASNKIIRQYQNSPAAHSTAGQAKSQIPNICKSDNTNDKSRYFIKIQDGCEQYCSYCVIPYARGKLKSGGEKKILDEIKNAVEAGYREIILSGIHIGLYGKDKIVKSPKPARQSAGASRRLAGGSKVQSLVGLLKNIIKINNIGRVRISSIEITEVTLELIKLMASTDKICNHLHISLQSGYDKILKLMNRPYTTRFFKKRIKKLRKAIPGIAITTDVIVGFPGETEADFKKTYEFCKKINFSKMHVFSFSAHEKTPAFHMKNKVSKEKIAERSKKLRALSVNLEKDYKNKFKGRELKVVVLGRIKEGKCYGKTEYFFDVEFNKKEKVGSIVSVKKWK